MPIIERRPLWVIIDRSMREMETRRTQILFCKKIN